MQAGPALARPPLAVHLYVTPRCNLSCPHCYYDALERTSHPADLLSLERIEEVLNDLAERCRPDVHLEGGEPFIRRGVDRLLDRLDPSVLATITVTTNGTVRLRSESETLRALAGLRISVDGHTDALQREMRGVELAKVLRTFRDLQARDVPFMARMTLWQGNVEALDDIYAWVEENDVTRLSLYEFQPSGRGAATDARFRIDDGAFASFLDAFATTTPPGCLERLTLHLAERRVGALDARRAELRRRGLTTRLLPPAANCTINYDGAVGISPWRVTAHGAADVFTTLDAEDFWDVLLDRARGGALDDDSACISRAVVELER